MCPTGAAPFEYDELPLVGRASLNLDVDESNRDAGADDDSKRDVDVDDGYGRLYAPPSFPMRIQMLLIHVKNFQFILKLTTISTVASASITWCSTISLSATVSTATTTVSTAELLQAVDFWVDVLKNAD